MEGMYWKYDFNTNPAYTLPTMWRTSPVSYAYPFVEPVFYNWQSIDKENLSTNVVTDFSTLARSSQLILAYGQDIADEVAKQRYENEFRHLVIVAAQNARALDINTIAFVRDARKIFDEIKSVRNIFRKGKIDGKDLADLYLSYKYGARLTVLDAIKVAQAVVRRATAARQKFSICRARSVGVSNISAIGLGALTGEVAYNIKLYYQPVDNILVSALRKCYEWDVWPDLTNVWDLIPYSFVVDWFIGVGDVLEQVDAITYFYTLDVLSCLTTAKTTFSDLPVQRLLVSGGPTILGTWETSIYSRVQRDVCPVPLMTFESPGSFRNYAEATALLIQRKRR